jgi:hypothetical protein
VELPGIEPDTKSGVTCGNAKVDDAKRRETTCGYAKDVDGINTPVASAAVVIEIFCLERPASHTTHGSEARHQIGFFGK